MKRGRRPEPTLPGNPRRLTINQHVHSRWCIERFADAKGRVAVLRRGEASFTTKPHNAIFCAQRAWSQKLEVSLFRKTEDAFHAVVRAVLSGAPVPDHDAVTAYLAIWQQRSRFAKEPPKDITLNGVNSSDLDKEQEETLESRGYGFARGNVVPGRIAAHVTAVRDYHMTMHALAGTQWGVVVASGNSFFLCPDDPQGELYVPISPRFALLAGYKDQELPASTVFKFNREAERRAIYLFGHPEDISAFAST